MNRTPILLVVLLACTREGAPARRMQATNDATTVRRAVPDSMAVRITGPTLIAFYPWVTQAQVDSSDDVATVLDDFSYHLSTAQDSLRAMGFAIVERPHGRLRIIDGSASREIVPAPDSADVGYVFAAPGRQDRISYGVMTGTDLVASGRRFLGPTTGRPVDRRPDDR